jgi:hypothetical protein
MRVVAVASLLALTPVGCGASADAERASVPAAGPRVIALVPVGEPGYGIDGIAVGEGAVWAAVGPFVDRIDPESARVTARLPLGKLTWAVDVDAGEGAAWVATEKAVLRLNPRTAEEEARIPLPRPGSPSGLVVGFGAVWVSVSHGPRAGEVVRIDPSTNQVAARISTLGYAGELEAGAGAVWVLSHPEYTDETRIEETTIHRIDPATSRLDKSPISERGVMLGGSEIPRLMASDDDSLWVGAFESKFPYVAAAVRVVTSGRFWRRPLGIKRFFPIAVGKRGVWFYGPDAGISLLNPNTLEVEESVDVDATGGDADLDPARDAIWLEASIGRGELSKAIRVDLR